MRSVVARCNIGCLLTGVCVVALKVSVCVCVIACKSVCVCVEYKWENSSCCEGVDVG